MAGKQAFHKANLSRIFGHPSGRAKTELRVGLYARVSTHDQHTIPLQTRAMRQDAAMRAKALSSGRCARPPISSLSTGFENRTASDSGRRFRN